MSTLKTTNLQNADASSANIVLGQGSGGGVTITGVTTTTTLQIADDIIHTGDTNTKIRFPDVDTITAETGGSERLRIDSSGNIGIDQTTPSSFGKFVVNGTGNIISLTSSSGAGSLAFFEGGTGRFYIKTLNGSDGLAFVDADNSTERLRIDSSGHFNISGITTAKTFVPTEGQLSHRNLVINGAMTIAQRGTSSTTAGYKTVDRFNTGFANCDEAPTFAQVDVTADTDPWNAGFRKAFKVTNGNQTSGAGAADDMSISQNIEAQFLANSGWDYTSSSSYITLSFWAKSSVAQTFYTGFRIYGSDQREYCFSYTLAANTWKKVTHSIPGGSGHTLLNTNALGAFIQWPQWWGTNYTSSGRAVNTWQIKNNAANYPDNTSTWFTTNDATFELTGVQLEVGPAATPFEHRTRADELRRCQRYYWTINRWMGGARGSGSTRSFTVFTPTEMRLCESPSSGTYTNSAVSGGDVAYVGATREKSDVTVNTMAMSSTSSPTAMQANVTVGYSMGSSDGGMVSGLYLSGFTMDHEI